MECVNINFIANTKVQPQEIDQDIVLLDGATSELDLNITHFIPGTMSNALSEPHDSLAPSNKRSERV